MIERKSFKEFVIEIANMDDDDYSGLSYLPTQAKDILLEKPSELNPWDLLDQAQIEQHKLESHLAQARAVLEKSQQALVIIVDYFERNGHKVCNELSIAKRALLIINALLRISL